MENLETVLAFVEKHGLVNQVLDKLLSPESLKAVAEGLGKGLAEGLKERSKNA
jgi:hypothetical protein